MGHPAGSADALPFPVQVQSGRFPGWTHIHKFGRNETVAAGAVEDIWQVGGAYPFLQTADTVRIKAGGDAADTAAGLGAQAIMIQGLDENWELAEESVITAGANASLSTSTTFIRVYRGWVSACGTYGGDNEADIDIETTGGTTLARIAAGFGQTQLAVYTIPAGRTGFMSDIDIYVESSKAMDMFLYHRENADVIVAPFSARRVLHFFPQVTGHLPKPDMFPHEFPARTDVWMAGKGAAGGSSASAEFELLLGTP